MANQFSFVQFVTSGLHISGIKHKYSLQYNLSGIASSLFCLGCRVVYVVTLFVNSLLKILHKGGVVNNKC